jgi:hypothetical protein
MMQAIPENAIVQLSPTLTEREINVHPFLVCVDGLPTADEILRPTPRAAFAFMTP